MLEDKGASVDHDTRRIRFSPGMITDAVAKAPSKVLDMAAMIAGSHDKLMERPFISLITSIAISPLKLCTQSTLIMQEANRNNIPVAISSAPMAGSNYIHHRAGMLESMLTIAHEQFVMDDEIIGNCCRVLKGIDVDPEHLAMEVIEKIGPGGNFMAAPHTMKFMRSEFFQGNDVTNRKSRDRWETDVAPGSPEFGLMMAGMTQLGKHINLPAGTGMFMTDSAKFDIQAGLEKMGGTILPLMSGADF